MYTYTFGGKNGKKHILHESNDMVVVRLVKSPDSSASDFQNTSRNVLRNFNLETEFPEAGIAVYKAKASVKNRVLARDNARSSLKKKTGVRFAGRVLVEEDGRTIVLYTENIFIKFMDSVKVEACEKILDRYKLAIKQKPGFAPNTYFVAAPDNTGLEIFNIAEKLLKMKEVELCHPELIRKKALKIIHPLQWHLKPSVINGKKVNADVKAEEAQKLSSGRNVIIALIDDGFDIDHPEFSRKGKVVSPKDIVSGSKNPRPRYSHENHGTACAGVATASGINASGVAPEAALMPVRLSSNLGSMAEANAFKWAADNGADIISCSWGPADGDWSNPNDPTHKTFTDLPDSTRLAMDYAISGGRKGKGCIITFAAGNGNEDIKYDGYASYQKVIAVAACNDTNRRSVYSDYGKSVWCSFPSSDLGYAPFHHPEPLTNGIYTTDRVGEEGYNPYGDYTDDFGGTSSSCPGVAGIIALMFSANPDLGWQQVREIIKDTCEKVDVAGGKYDSHGHSKYYGYGKADAEKAVRKAIELKAPGSLKGRRNNKYSANAGKQSAAEVKTRKSKKETV
jgi:Subtilisin-like serine proteases